MRNKLVRERETTVKTVKHIVDILTCFSIRSPELGISEISRRTGLYKSTVYRLLRSLVEAGMVVQDPKTKKYSLGFKVFELGCAVLTNAELRRAALPVMEELGERTRETINLSVVNNGERVCIEKVESKEAVRNFVELGMRAPLYCGATGKVLLAFMSEEEARRVLDRQELISPVTGGSIDRTILEKELEVIRYQGYAVTREERSLGAASVSAPIRDHTGRVVAALTISGPTSRFSPERVVELIREVKGAAGAISQRLGYSG